MLVYVIRSNDPIRGRARCEAEAKHNPSTSRVGVGPEREKTQGTPKHSERISRFIRPCVSTVLGGRSPPATATPGKALAPIYNLCPAFHVESPGAGTESTYKRNNANRIPLRFRSRSSMIR